MANDAVRHELATRSDSSLPSLSSHFRDASLHEKYIAVRQVTHEQCAELSDEDMAAQSMADASPTKWHLAHTTWFFEMMVLTEHDPARTTFHPEFNFLFNSYYNAIGPRHARPQRGQLTRPSFAQVLEYRRFIDEQMVELLASDRVPPELAVRIELGLHHEQQHQELMLTDIKHLFSRNPLLPAYRKQLPLERIEAGNGGSPDGRPQANSFAGRAKDADVPTYWHHFDEGVYRIGYSGDEFHFDNETPCHRVFLEPFSLADRLVTNEQFLQFIEDGGYQTADWWLDLGWATVQAEGWQSPLYWACRDGEWREFRLDGLQPLEPASPVCHLSYFEAEAYARWARARLPTEAEWEVAASDLPMEGNFVESRWLHPQPTPWRTNELRRPRQMYGDVWEWTVSSYSPYPGHSPWPGAVGEYNGKFMCNQYVLRGGACVSSSSHLRLTYRNFFPPQARWQFSGLRLARSLTS